jgi:hypothetical protein
MNLLPMERKALAIGLGLSLLCAVAQSQASAHSPRAQFQREVDAIATQALEATGTSSAQLAIVRDGQDTVRQYPAPCRSATDRSKAENPPYDVASARRPARCG